MAIGKMSNNFVLGNRLCTMMIIIMMVTTVFVGATIEQSTSGKTVDDELTTPEVKDIGAALQNVLDDNELQSYYAPDTKESTQDYSNPSNDPGLDDQKFVPSMKYKFGFNSIDIYYTFFRFVFFMIIYICF